ncbi:transposase [Pseudomonas orientalis]|uniref:Putative transposase n=1 Tax=Pseudomonas orientalis TaxID=76758 RepID=A0A8B3Y0Z4_9PSED|nr:transposase [Pseudomonas orientalis]SDU21814.1 putative transposase [Pseudomonas orientalis]
MARRPRVLLPDIPLHIIQRGNNRAACFYADKDYIFYIDTLAELAELYGCKVHALCLMTNHVHLLLTPTCCAGASLLMKGLGQRYVQYVNRTYQRTGTLWEGRFRSCLVQQENYVLACYRYIEMNPVRAGMVAHPGDYRWTSYRANAQGELSGFISPHAVYSELGSGAAQRAEAYRSIFMDRLSPELIEQIRSSTNGNYVLGNQKFASEIAQILEE